MLVGTIRLLGRKLRTVLWRSQCRENKAFVVLI